ncbi:MAG: nucleotidyltransferase domain-containing protein [Candidatus Kapabacteria bacterium]|nr:nucleotidyltransferase domain-containing protein [Ignavibacteriota bacterium]MCW5884640.1 nucleotidyltransferase domain-containing protein [Candidatus Kapabacteria bacterium]
MNQEIIDKITILKNQLMAEGFIIEGIFGSYIRGENNPESDIDILYNLNSEFRNNYKGFKAVAKIDSIQEFISNKLKINADLVYINSLNSISAEYILPEVMYVV